MGSSAEFLIDIKQQASGNALSMLDQLSSRMDNAIAHYKSLESASLSANKKLESVGAKMSSAHADLSAATKTGDTAGAARASNAIAKLAQDETKLKQEAAIANAELKKQEAVVSKLANQKGAMEKHSKAMEHAEKQAETLGQRSKKLGNAFGGLPGPLGRVGQGIGSAIDDFSDMKESMGTMGATAAVAGVAVVAIAVALIFAAGKATLFAIQMASAARDTELTTQAILENEEAGSQLSESYQDISNSTGIASDRLVAIARSLKAANVQASDMPEALRAIAEQESALGDSGGTQALIDKLKSGQKSVGDLASEMDSKFGGIVESKMLGLDQQIARLKSGFAGMLAGLHIEPFLKGLKTIVDLFDSSTAAGKQMQDTLRMVFQPLVDGATSAFPTVRRMILSAELAVVEFMVAIDPVATQIRDMFATGPLGDFIVAMATGSGVASVFTDQISGFVAVLELGVAQLNFWIDLVDQLSGGLSGLGGAASGASSTLGNLTGSAANATSGAPAEMSDVGVSMTDGLASGIDSGTIKVVGAVNSLGASAVGAALDAFDIHSPSKVFEHIGDMNVAGLVGAHQRGANDVEASVEDMTQLPTLTAPGRGGAAGGTARFEFNFTITGSNPEEVKSAAREGVRMALEEAGLEYGLDVFADEDEEAA